MECHFIELIVNPLGLICFFAARLPRGLAHQNTGALYPLGGLRQHISKPILNYVAFPHFSKIYDRLYFDKVLSKSVVALRYFVLILFSELFIQRTYDIFIAPFFLDAQTPPVRGWLWAPSVAIEGKPGYEFFSATHVNNSSSKIIIFVYETYFLI